MLELPCILFQNSKLKTCVFNSIIPDDTKTEDEKQKIDQLMEELVSLVNKKDILSQKLINHEAE